MQAFILDHQSIFHHIHLRILNQLRNTSIDTSIDFRDFVKYLTNKRLVVQIKDAQKCLNIGYIKVPLKDLISQGKDKIKITKEYEIFDDNFNI